MLCFIVSGEDGSVRQINWRVGERLELRPPTSVIIEAYADKAELKFIEENFRNIPFGPKGTGTVWTGIYAQFIFNNIDYRSILEKIKSS